MSKTNLDESIHVELLIYTKERSRISGMCLIPRSGALCWSEVLGQMHRWVDSQGNLHSTTKICQKNNIPIHSLARGVKKSDFDDFDYIFGMEYVSETQLT